MRWRQFVIVLHSKSKFLNIYTDLIEFNKLNYSLWNVFGGFVQFSKCAFVLVCNWLCDINRKSSAAQRYNNSPFIRILLNVTLSIFDQDCCSSPTARYFPSVWINKRSFSANIIPVEILYSNWIPSIFQNPSSEVRWRNIQPIISIELCQTDYNSLIIGSKFDIFRLFVLYKSKENTKWSKQFFFSFTRMVYVQLIWRMSTSEYVILWNSNNLKRKLSISFF